eukprot:1168056-Rhodomonas_salina.5
MYQRWLRFGERRGNGVDPRHEDDSDKGARIPGSVTVHVGPEPAGLRLRGQTIGRYPAGTAEGAQT